MARGRMQPLCAVNVRDEIIDAGASTGEALEGARIQFLSLERLHDGFGLGIAERVTWPRHGDSDVMFSEALMVVVGCVLDGVLQIVISYFRIAFLAMPLEAGPRHSSQSA
jgi:hypothetical protein